MTNRIRVPFQHMINVRKAREECRKEMKWRQERSQSNRDRARHQHTEREKREGLGRIHVGCHLSHLRILRFLNQIIVNDSSVEIQLNVDTRICPISQ